MVVEVSITEESEVDDIFDSVWLDDAGNVKFKAFARVKQLMQVAYTNVMMRYFLTPDDMVKVNGRTVFDAIHQPQVKTKLVLVCREDRNE